MTLDQALEYVKPWMQPDGTLSSPGTYIELTEQSFVIDSAYCTADMCRALAIYCDHMGWHQ